MLEIEGIVEDIIFSNDENGYAVCEIMQSTEGSITAVGYIPFIHEGDMLRLSGEWINHMEYGTQFKVSGYVRIMPKTVSDIYQYLSSGIIKGIRSSTALKITNAFGEATLEIIRDEPAKLTKIKGISLNRAMSISQEYIQKQNIQNIVIFFQQHQIPLSFARKVQKRWGENAIRLIQENPYILCEQIEGIGFKTADKIALSMGVSHQSMPRICAGMVYVLQEAATQGNTYLPKEEFITCAVNFLEIVQELASGAMVILVATGQIKLGSYHQLEVVYLPAFYAAEYSVAMRITDMAEVSFGEDMEQLEKELVQIQQSMGIALAENQLRAVKLAVTNGTLIITGGPGTGKTTIIKAIIQLMEKRGVQIFLAAPTGRAAKRMSELCGYEAKTIHRLIEMEFSQTEGKWVFARNEKNPLETGIVIVDEMSMVDILLMSSLMKAMPKGSRLIMVGDADQLPSVGAGNVLQDMLASGIVAAVVLKEIFRQATKSMIVVNAHRINRGEYPIICKDKDFFHISRQDANDCVNEILGLCAHRLPQYLKLDPLWDIQVLTPVRKGACGVEALNARLQQLFNPPEKDKKELKRNNYTLREGDKIMQTKNNYDIGWIRDDQSGQGIYNGDIGIVQSIDKEEIVILFDGDKVISFQIDEMEDIELAYAMTVHKSQGSEFKVVIMPMMPVNHRLLSRNLFYTGVTRAKEMVVLVGREDVVRFATDNHQERERYSGLGYMLGTKEQPL